MKIKANWRLLAVCIVFTAAFTCSCSDARRNEISNGMDELGKNLDTAAQQTRAAFTRDKENFSTAVNRQIEKNRQDIAELKAKAKLKKADAKKHYDATIDTLEKKNDALKAKLDEYNYQSKEKWQSFKEEFSHDMDELGQGIGDLFRDNVK